VNNETPQTIHVAEQKIKNISLPDGSSVMLNIQSKLSYDEGFGVDHRNITLTGEAFFDVEREESLPFSITSDEVKTTVLGTSFNVLAYANEPSIITVKSGIVKVNHKGKSVTLLPGEQVLTSLKGLKKNKLAEDVDRHFQWTEGDLVIPNLQLDQALSRIARYYGFNLEMKSTFDGACQLRGVFSKEESLSDILYGLKYSYEEFNYELKDREIIVDSFSCK